MDLEAEAERLGLDILATRVGRRLDEFSVPYLLLKGPSTASWLYDPPRRYRDVDVLVPETRLGAALDALCRDGLATPAGGRPGEVAHHSVLLRSAAGFEVDLHLTLPALPRAGDRVFGTLWPHRVLLDLGPGSVWALDEAARCLVLALHAVGSGSSTGQAADDLRAARRAAQASSWAAALGLATQLDASDLMQAGVSLVEPDAAVPDSRRSRLYAEQAPSSALGLQRLSELSARQRPAALLREMFPSHEFMNYAAGTELDRPELVLAHLRRWRHIAGELPHALRTWRAAGPDR